MNLSLEKFTNMENLKIIIGGGDGTIGWILNAIDEVKFKYRPSVAILPLGTGNDLARCLGWGFKFNGKPMDIYLNKVALSKPSNLDR